MSGRIYLDTVIRPARAASPRAVQLVFLLFGIVSFAIGLAYYALGFWPVLGFFGLDVLLLFVAFRAVQKRQRQHTRITVTADTLRMVHTRTDGSVLEAEFPTAFVRVEYDEAPDHRLPGRLTVEYGRQAFSVGGFLAEPEKKALRQRMRAAILQSRRRDPLPEGGRG